MLFTIAGINLMQGFIQDLDVVISQLGFWVTVRELWLPMRWLWCCWPYDRFSLTSVSIVLPLLITHPKATICLPPTHFDVCGRLWLLLPLHVPGVTLDFHGGALTLPGVPSLRDLPINYGPWPGGIFAKAWASKFIFETKPSL